ncbi:hypothetical protein [uncultured Cellulomonas sp.]|uniref:hypothetical protein n=1 Tax=uncultured Cellulomonas sp. TaxID=189682 RepID=UPI0026183C3E|nr:hypothetical protein [uncultured Cellulomonas sp.]
MDPNDLMVLVVVLVLFAGPILAGGTQMGRRALQSAVAWLTGHHVLVTEAVIVSVPYAGEAGLDTGRIILAAGVLLAVVAGVVGTVRSRRRRAVNAAR